MDDDEVKKKYDEEFKKRVLQAFAEGTDPIQAVIDFEEIPEKIQRIYVEYCRMNGKVVLWGDAVRKIEKRLGLPIESIRTPDDLVNALEKFTEDEVRGRMN